MGGDPPAPSTPPPRDVGKETRDSLQAQVDLAPDVYASEAQYRPLYSKLDTQILEEALLGSPDQRGLLNLFENDLYPFAREQGALDQQQSQEFLNQSRLTDIQAVEELGARANEAFKKSNPILSELTDQALVDVKKQGALTPDEERDVEQKTRAAFSARGMVRSNPSIVSEVLGKESLKRDKMFQDRDFALKVAGQQQDPFLAILGRPGTVVNSSGTAQSTFGNANYALGSDNKLFGMNQSQFSSYANNLNSENFEAANNAAIMTANAKAAGNAGMLSLAGAGIGAVGAIGAAF